MTDRISAIIPYYQEESGILREAVLSAFAQEGVSDLEIIVVDDGSPAPARNELKSLDLPAHVALQLIEQSNRGPGAARNCGLDNVSADTNYIAFLDSDDRWNRDHLLNAQFAFKIGYDMYISDYLLSESKRTLFAQGGYKFEQQPNREEGLRVHPFRPEDRMNLIRGKLCWHVSTLVYSQKTLGGIRFPETFWIGEDLAFLLKMCSVAHDVGFSSRVEAFSVPGTNIYKNGGWDTPRAIWVLSEIARSKIWIRDNIEMTEEERGVNEKRRSDIRAAFVLNVLHEMRNGRAFRNPDIAKFVIAEPKSLLYFLPLAAQQIIKQAWLSASSATERPPGSRDR